MPVSDDSILQKVVIDVAYIKESVDRMTAAMMGNGNDGVLTRLTVLEMKEDDAAEEIKCLKEEVKPLVAAKNKVIGALAIAGFSGGGIGALLANLIK